MSEVTPPEADPALKRLDRFVGRSSMEGRPAPLGPPFVCHHPFAETETEVEAGVPVRHEATGERGIELGLLPGGATIATLHLGSHDTLGEPYGRLDALRQEHRREAAGPPWEVYWCIDASRVRDPSSWPAPTECCAELVQPLAAVGAK